MKISLRNKILLLFLGLLVVSAVATIGAVFLATNNNVAVQAEEKLSVGQRVFEQLIVERGNQLFDSAAVLVADFGFKEAVTSQDTATIQSALENNSARINADLMMLLALNGQVIATSVDTQNSTTNLSINSEPTKALAVKTAVPFSFSELLTEAEEEGGLSRIVLLNGKIYQLVMLPVEAPIAVAWTIIGMHIDNDFANQLKELTNLEVTFRGEAKVGSNVGAKISAPAEVSTLIDAATIHRIKNDSDSMYLKVESHSQHYLTLPVALANTDQYQVDALLSTSLTEAYARFSPLKLQMLLIASAALLLSVIGAFFISRNVTRPISKLVEAARRISTGDYQQPIKVRQQASDEIGVLSESFQTMQQGIAEREEQLTFQAFHDSLTGVANRTLFAKRLAELLQSSDNSPITVLRLNVNQFKQVNDTFGYNVGDSLLKSVADILVKYSGDIHLTARLSADEFALLLPGTGEAQVLSRMVELQEKIQQPLTIADVNMKVSVSIGSALFPEHGDEPEQLLRRAEIALSRAQDQKLPYVCYQQGQDESHLRQIALVSELKIALENNQLQRLYQPKVDLQAGRVTQVEALLRWIHDDYGFVSPEEFIGLAEQSGLMPLLTEWVLQAVFSQAYRWQQAGTDVAIAVNLSAYDLVDDFPDKVETLMRAVGVTADRVIMEITESAVMKNPEGAIKVLHRLREIGLKLSIDDYGTGYSSLAQLKNMPVDELKIDKSFVMTLAEDDDDQVIVKSTIELAHNIGLTVVAEGVETLSGYQLLEQWGCDKLQGYYISRPLPVQDFETWLMEYEHPVIESRIENKVENKA